MSSLKGARVAVLEARMSVELAAMVERFGGVPYSVPAVRETPLEQPEDVGAFVDALCDGRFAIVVLMTGVGVAALLREAERLGRLDAVLAALRNTITVCRGPKPVAVLRRHDVQVNITAAEPHTTRSCCRRSSPSPLPARPWGSCTTASGTKPPRTACAPAARP